MAIIGEKVKELRTAKGWSQDTLATKIGGGVSQQNIQQLEDGIVRQPRYLLKLATTLGVTAESLSEDKSHKSRIKGNVYERPPYTANDKINESCNQYTELTDNERTLLNAFRAVTPEMQNAVLSLLRAAPVIPKASKFSQPIQHNDTSSDKKAGDNN